MRWFSLFLIAAVLFSQEEEPQIPSSIDSAEKEPEFWSTGPLLNYAGDIVELGHVAFEPYFILFQYRGQYDSDWHFHSNPIFTTFAFQPYTRIGICPRVEIDLTPQLFYNHVDGAGKWVFGDFPFWLSIALLESDEKIPSILLELLATLPTGKYQKLERSKLGTDVGGTGSWIPGTGLVLYKDFHLWNSHFLALTYSASYYFQTTVDVKGLNVYGGDETTSGKVHPGNIFQTFLSFEYSFTQNWLFSMDMEYQHGNRNRFSGETIEPIGDPSYERFSFAPAIEYLWNENSGIIFGSWFTVAGRNIDQFNTFEMAIYLYR